MMAGILDSRKAGCGSCSTKLRSAPLEYTCLLWDGAVPSHIPVLDRIQQRAEKLIEDGFPEQEATPIHSQHSLQHHRDMAGLATLYKVQEQWVSNLQELHLPPHHITNSSD
ncbi:hypothetical protein E2C01_044405 [Portunus trituberculatus]|uniref:Uncharacterized protein n=1 Tax=Portunus trituberculatus TaxID=210409 RepID=A0A5B7FYD3_PORTR|nr:hypothetical protein [Portunus trituberculatus]